jgi:Ca2+-binding EF-hand superfamily protein
MSEFRKNLKDNPNEFPTSLSDLKPRDMEFLVNYCSENDVKALDLIDEKTFTTLMRMIMFCSEDVFHDTFREIDTRETGVVTWSELFNFLHSMMMSAYVDAKGLVFFSNGIISPTLSHKVFFFSFFWV